VSVSADDVRDVINVTSEEVPDNKILKMIKRAEVTLELETDKTMDSSNCSDAEKEAITVLSTVYAICSLTGGSAVGLSFSVGDQNISFLDNAPPLTVLQAGLDCILNKLQQMTKKEVDRIKMVLKEVSGIYRKRITGARQPFLNKEEYEAIVEAADIIKLVKMLRVLGFLTQTKVYLFWKKEWNCIQFS
jgi:hypothetical protein